MTLETPIVFMIAITSAFLFGHYIGWLQANKYFDKTMTKIKSIQEENSTAIDQLHEHLQDLIKELNRKFGNIS